MYTYYVVQRCSTKTTVFVFFAQLQLLLVVTKLISKQFRPALSVAVTYSTCRLLSETSFPVSTQCDQSLVSQLSTCIWGTLHVGILRSSAANKHEAITTWHIDTPIFTRTNCCSHSIRLGQKHWSILDCFFFIGACILEILMIRFKNSIFSDLYQI